MKNVQKEQEDAGLYYRVVFGRDNRIAKIISCTTKDRKEHEGFGRRGWTRDLYGLNSSRISRIWTNYTILFGTRIAFQRLIITLMPQVVFCRATEGAADYFCAA